MRATTLSILAAIMFAAWVFRYDYHNKTITFPFQAFPSQSYEIIIRVDRYFSNSCLFEGGDQLVAMEYDARSPLSNERVSDLYPLQRCH